MTSKWRPEYEEIIRQRWSDQTLADIAQDIGISLTTIYRYVRRLKITPALENVRPASNRKTANDGKVYKRRRWTPQEEAYLMKYYGRYPVASLSRFLRRTRHSIVHHANHLGLSYQRSDLSMTINEVAEMLGTTSFSIIARTSGNAVNKMPHTRLGRFVEFGYTELYEWLDEGHILSFERERMSPDFHRIYDRWRAQVIISTEVYDECPPLGEWLRKGEGNAPEPVCVMPSNRRAYRKEDLFNWAYGIGHVITPWASPRLLVIKEAWDLEWIFKSEIYKRLPASTYRLKVKPYVDDNAIHVAVKRKALCARLIEIGRPDLAKLWKRVPIPWQELMADFERGKR